MENENRNINSNITSLSYDSTKVGKFLDVDFYGLCVEIEISPDRKMKGIKLQECDLLFLYERNKAFRKEVNAVMQRWGLAVEYKEK